MQRRPLRRRRCTHTGASCTLFYCYTHGPRCKQAQTSGQKRPGVTAGAAKHGMPRTARTPRPSSSGRGQCHRHAAACSSPPRSAASTSSLVSCAWMAVEAVAAHTPATHAPRTHGDLRHALAWAGERTGGRRRGAVRGQGELAHRGLQARLDVPARRRRRHEETTAHGAGASQGICVFNRAISCIPWERRQMRGRRAKAGGGGRAGRARAPERAHVLGLLLAPHQLRARVLRHHLRARARRLHHATALPPAAAAAAGPTAPS